MARHPRDLVIEVVLTWGDGATGYVLACAQVRKGGRFSLGDGAVCDAVVPAEVLESAFLEVVRWESEPRVVPPPGAFVLQEGEPVSSSTIVPVLGQTIDMSFGGFALRVRLVEAERLVALRRPSIEGMGSIVVSAAAHASCIAVLAASASSISANQNALSLDRLRLMRHLLEASEREVAPREERRARSRSSRRAPQSSEARLSVDAPVRADPKKVNRESQPEPTPEAEPPLGGDGDGVNVVDVGGLLASLKRRLSHPLPGGIAQVPNTRDTPQDSLRPPYPLISDGRLDKEAIRRVVSASMKNLLSCLADAPRARGSAAGHVAVTFTVGSFGQVVAAHDVGGDAPLDVRACIVRGFYMLTFPAPERGTATVTYPLLLAPAE
jgi:hypothetical protein